MYVCMYNYHCGRKDIGSYFVPVVDREDSLGIPASDSVHKGVVIIIHSLEYKTVYWSEKIA